MYFLVFGATNVVVRLVTVTPDLFLIERQSQFKGTFFFILFFQAQKDWSISKGLIDVEGLDLIESKPYREALAIILEEHHINEENLDSTIVKSVATKRERSPKIVKVTDVQNRIEKAYKCKIVAGGVASFIEMGFFVAVYYVLLTNQVGFWFGAVAFVWFGFWYSILNLLFITDSYQWVVVTTEKLRVKMKNGCRWGFCGVSYKIIEAPAV